MVRTRFAPSPTGYLHIGGARTALFSWAYARKMGGAFVLRIEDTDQERSTQASVQAILDGLAWLGIDWDEGPHYQMQRMERYKAVVDQLLEAGQAYYCYASREELDAMREARYAGWTGPLGRSILSGEASLETLAARVDGGEIDPRPVSGRQELLENVVNQSIWAVDGRERTETGARG